MERHHLFMDYSHKFERGHHCFLFMWGSVGHLDTSLFSRTALRLDDMQEVLNLKLGSHAMYAGEVPVT